MNEFRLFVSYTNREDEVQKIKPLISRYRELLLTWATQNGIEIFYDEFSIPKGDYTETEMKEILSEAIAKSDLMTAFVSDGYISSDWCQFEWLESRENQHPPLHAILWKRITHDLSWLGIFGDVLAPEKLTDVSGQSMEPTSSQLEALAKICIEDSKYFIRRKYGLPIH